MNLRGKSRLVLTTKAEVTGGTYIHLVWTHSKVASCLHSTQINAEVTLRKMPMVEVQKLNFLSSAATKGNLKIACW